VYYLFTRLVTLHVLSVTTLIVNALSERIASLMPAFLPLRVGKRKQDSTFEADANPKKQASRDGGDDLHWMVQWYIQCFSVALNAYK